MSLSTLNQSDTENPPAEETNVTVAPPEIADASVTAAPADTAPVVVSPAPPKPTRRKKPAPLPVEPAPVKRMSIRAFCRGLRSTERYTMLYAFRRAEERARRTVDTAANYQDRLTAFKMQATS